MTTSLEDLRRLSEGVLGDKDLARLRPFGRLCPRFRVDDQARHEVRAGRCRDNGHRAAEAVANEVAVAG